LEKWKMAMTWTCAKLGAAARLKNPGHAPHQHWLAEAEARAINAAHNGALPASADAQRSGHRTLLGGPKKTSMNTDKFRHVYTVYAYVV
jgi:hypothetical protein